MLLNVQRLICLVIDVVIIYLPSLLITEIMFNRIGGLSVLLAQFLFIIYNVVCVSSFDGKTLGKYFGKIQVVYPHKETIMMQGMRELSKLLYVVPYINLVFLMTSLVLKGIKGNFLHDIIGNSTVIPAKLPAETGKGN